MDWKNPPLHGVHRPPVAGVASQRGKRKCDDAADAWKRPHLSDQGSESQAARLPPASAGQRGASSGSSANAMSWKQPSGGSPQSTVHNPPTRVHSPLSTDSWKNPHIDDAPPPPTPCSETQRAPRHAVNMCSVMLQLILPGEVNTEIKYRQDAANPDRIRDVLSKRYCHSKDDCALCNKRLQSDAMIDLVQMWVKLGDEAQVNYLSCMYEGTTTEHDMANVPEDVQHRTDYYVDGAKVCHLGFCGLLGTTPRTLAKRLHRTVDMRKKLPGDSGARPERQTATPLIDLFFMELYHGAAEDLPENDHTHDVDAGIQQDHEQLPVHCPQEASISDLFTWTPEAAISERAAHFIGPNASAPVRHLPPGKPITLFWQFLCWFEAIREMATSPSTAVKLPFLKAFPSWTTFHRRWFQKWSRILRFRKTSQHKECSMCHDFRCALHKRGVPTGERMASARQWREHLRAQYHDRLLYWSLRWASRMYMDVLVIIIDSMDKVKTMYPKYRAHRKPAYLDGLVRPRQTLSAVLCHGWCTCVYTADEFLSHGASAFCEILCRALDQVFAISRRTRRPMPRHLVIQSDNTTAQAKNCVVSVFLAYLVAKGYFQTAVINFLTVGHTHEDVDRLFAMILLLVLRPKLWETPEEMNKLIEEALRPLSSAKNEQLIVGEVKHIRDFDSWLDGMGVRIHNAFVTRNGREASHAFTYKVRSDLTAAEVSNIPRKRKRFVEHQEDVFAVVKGRMHMTKTQPPVLAVPHCLVALIDGKQPRNMKAARDMPDARKKELIKLADRLDSNSGERYENAAKAICERLEHHAPAVQAPKLEYLSSSPCARAPVASTSNQYYEHLPDTAWRLLASFRRNPIQA